MPCKEKWKAFYIIPPSIMIIVLMREIASIKMQFPNPFKGFIETWKYISGNVDKL